MVNGWAYLRVLGHRSGRKAGFRTQSRRARRPPRATGSPRTTRDAQAGMFVSHADAADSPNDQQRLVGLFRGAVDAMNRATTALTQVAQIGGGA